MKRPNEANYYNMSSKVHRLKTVVITLYYNQTCT